MALLTCHWRDSAIKVHTRLRVEDEWMILPRLFTPPLLKYKNKDKQDVEHLRGILAALPAACTHTHILAFTTFFVFYFLSQSLITFIFFYHWPFLSSCSETPHLARFHLSSPPKKAIIIKNHSNLFIFFVTEVESEDAAPPSPH